MNPVDQVHALGQSLWLDYIRRDLIISGDLRAMIDKGEIRGVTSNPTIFENAISSSELYSPDLRAMAQAGWKADAIFDCLAIDDIRGAADAFLPLYERTNGGDGFVSIEVNPMLADDTKGTLKEARRLWDEVNRPNAMIKIPATQAGIPAIESAIAAGINVNVTLIFSLERYSEVMEAYLRGLEKRLEQGGSLEHVASVASFFISRVDSEVDKRLSEFLRREGPEAERAAALMGKAAIANAKLAYAQYEAVFSSERFQHLALHGAKVQRPLWASTSTKNPDYPDTYYVDTLIGPDTVNTLPANTLDAFRDHGRAQLTLQQGLSESRAQLGALEALGISMEEVSQLLEHEGVEKFAKSFEILMASLKKKANAAVKEIGPLTKDVQATIGGLDRDEVARRLWSSDTTLWATDKEGAAEAAGRLGWLTLPQDMVSHIADLERFAGEIREAGISRAVLLGMGGSSLASEVMSRVLARDSDFEFFVLDSTDPAAIASTARKAPLKSTLFIVSSKSGGTIEAMTLMDHFWEKAYRSKGKKAGQHFIAITDPGSDLELAARERGFRRIFSTPITVGGRYSALTYFGLVSAALMGLDLVSLLQGGERMARACGPQHRAPRNLGLHLGAVLGAAGLQGRDKITFVADPSLEPFADWIEQLLAESSGKKGRGLTPVVGEPPAPGKRYGDDRLMVYLRSEGKLDRKVGGWIKSKLPVLILEMPVSARGMGGAFFLWEFATAVVCHLLGVNAFNQPDVQSAKNRTNDLLGKYESEQALPLPEAVWQGEGIVIRGDPRDSGAGITGPLADALARIIVDTGGRNTLGLLFFAKPTPALEKQLKRVRGMMRDMLGRTTIAGIGPRYLHSTGQLHKGGPDQAVYLIVSSTPDKDVEIPHRAYTFGVLERAQAVGDYRALIDSKRPAYFLDLDSPGRVKDVLGALGKAVERAAKS
jgi:transaldolase/glucose-6-phosphate isomerase